MSLSMEEAIARVVELRPYTMATIEEAYDLIFAPWVKAQGLEFLEIEPRRVKARLPQDPRQQFLTGAMCGQAIMSAIDTVMSLAMNTFSPSPGGTASQSNQFLKPAMGDNLIIEATVLRVGRRLAYGETFVRFEGNDDLVAHSTSTYAF